MGSSGAINNGVLLAAMSVLWLQICRVDGSASSFFLSIDLLLCIKTNQSIQDSLVQMLRPEICCSTEREYRTFYKDCLIS